MSLKNGDIRQGNRATPAFKAGALHDSEGKDGAALDVNQLPNQQSEEYKINTGCRMSEIIEERTEDYYNTKNSFQN